MDELEAKSLQLQILVEYVNEFHSVTTRFEPNKGTWVVEFWVNERHGFVVASFQAFDEIMQMCFEGFTNGEEQDASAKSA